MLRIAARVHNYSHDLSHGIPIPNKLIAEIRPRKIIQPALSQDNIVKCKDSHSGVSKHVADFVN